MESAQQSTLTPGGPPALVTRVNDTQWQAVADGQVVGCGDVSFRPDGRAFLSIDAWHQAVFDRIAAEMAAALPMPLYTLVDEADRDLRSGWTRVGFAVGRREREYVLPTDPHVTGLDERRVPLSDMTILPAGEAAAAPLRALADTVRAEVEATVGWRTMPAEVLPRPAGTTVVDPLKYAVAVRSGQYVGLVRLSPHIRQPRIGLLAVLAEQRRQGVARALLAHALGSLHRAGTDSARAEVTETNAAAVALFEGIGARHVGSSLELVLR
ncbi:N-acetyltransferase family protein [Streptacidiphilus sp. N1-12]|uniref:N-acetyltransferase family protein n=2 Tax=Streptacidiphilus alkalitolerans TaxID=3342712 RepID=A0ABV6XD52_9ACTN